jgi:hypothetical protein
MLIFTTAALICRVVELQKLNIWHAYSLMTLTDFPRIAVSSNFTSYGSYGLDILCFSTTFNISVLYSCNMSPCKPLHVRLTVIRQLPSSH